MPDLNGSFPRGARGGRSSGVAVAAHRAVAHAVSRVLAAGVAPAEDGGGDAGGALWVLLRGQAADHLPHGAVHVLVLVGVDDGVHDRVEQREQEEPPFHVLHPTLRAVQAVQEQHQQAGGPAHHKGPCRER